MESGSKIKILFYGYFGFGNTGDEAILESQTNIIRQLNPNVELSVLTGDERRAKELHIKPYGRMDLYEIYKAITECDLVISGGGGLIQDETGEFTPWHYALFFELAAISKKPIFIFGQGFGPISSEVSKSYLYKFLPFCTKATFRDEDSLNLFKIYAPNVPAICTADPAFYYKTGQHDKGIEYLKKIGVKDFNKKIIYLTLREIPILEEFVPDGINKWYDNLKEKNIQIVIIPFQYRYDLNVSKKISKKLKIENYVCDEISVSDIMNIFAVQSSELIISTRLHGIILGSISNKCCLGISYSCKVESICKKLNSPYIKSDEMNQEKFINLLNNTWENRNEIRKKGYEIALKEKEKVIETAKMALELVHN